MTANLVEELKALKSAREFFVGVDSDGCVFDTMELKQKECVIPATCRHFGLQAVAKYAREASEFVSLYSKWRGSNRFPALVRTLDLLRERPEVKKRGVEIPRLDSLRRWMAEETRLSTSALAAKVEATGDAELRRVLAWSEAVNRSIAETVAGTGVFAFARESLERAREKADLAVVSQTPIEALRREWAEHDVGRLVRVICGQEYGTKAEQIEYAAGGKYPKDKMLMIGDAPGDRAAAEANGALFYPIVPGDEDASWERFHDEGLERFFAGTFAGDYQTRLIERFESLLPDKPVWNAE